MMFRQWLALCMLLTLALSATTGYAQDDNIDALLDTALEYLSAQLDTPTTRADLSRWTWQEDFWPDTSLGCPQPDQVYAQVTTRGYVFILTISATLYEVHVTSDGTSAILCTSATAATPDPQPGGTITDLASQPDALLDAVLAYLNAQLDDDIARSHVIRWMWEEALWTDTALDCPMADEAVAETEPVNGYALTLEHTGRTYTLHLTLDGQTIRPCGIDLLSPMIDGTIVPASPEIHDGSLIFTGPDGNVHLTTLTTYPGHVLTGDTADIAPTPAPLAYYDADYGYYTWSPDGQYAAFVDNVLPARLLLTDTTGGEPLVLADPVAPRYPPAWNPDGTMLAFVRPTQLFRGSSQVMEIYGIRFPLDANEIVPQQLGTFEQQIGCTGGSADPADVVYYREAGFNGSPLVLEWLTDSRLLLSHSCSGIGISQLDLASGMITPLSSTMGRVSFNPDGSYAAGINFVEGQTPSAAIISAAGSIQPLTLGFTPERVYWTSDGQHLFISETTGQETLIRPDTQETISSYIVRLYEYDTITGDVSRRFEQEGRGIARMVEAPDGSGLLFVFVESARGWLSALNTGATAAVQREAAPASWLLFLTHEGRIIRLGRGGQPAFQPVLVQAQG